MGLYIIKHIDKACKKGMAYVTLIEPSGRSSVDAFFLEEVASYKKGDVVKVTEDASKAVELSKAEPVDYESFIGHLVREFYRKHIGEPDE